MNQHICVKEREREGGRDVDGKRDFNANERKKRKKTEKSQTHTNTHTDAQEIRGRNDLSTKPGTERSADRSSVVC